VLWTNAQMLPWRSLLQWHRLNGIDLPQDDRLHHVASTFGSEAAKDAGVLGYRFTQPTIGKRLNSQI
jgi:hypothetical protein